MFLHVGKFVLYENTDHRGLYYAGLGKKRLLSVYSFTKNHHE